jgi:GNAT superfamily N-acetyltransferase
VLDIRPATEAELGDVLSVLDEAAAWLQSIGVTEQWPASFSADAAWVERLRRGIENEQVYVAHDGGTAQGCFRLLNEDGAIWQDASRRYVYLHSLAVRRASAGRGVATAMLDFAVQVAASHGAEELRLDCWAGNERLMRYYLDAGFELRGQHHVAIDNGVWGKSDYWVAKFAKRVAPEPGQA